MLSLAVWHLFTRYSKKLTISQVLRECNFLNCKELAFLIWLPAENFSRLRLFGSYVIKQASLLHRQRTNDFTYNSK
jgi:hypothetical protein